MIALPVHGDDEEELTQDFWALRWYAGPSDAIPQAHLNPLVLNYNLNREERFETSLVEPLDRHHCHLATTLVRGSSFYALGLPKTSQASGALSFGA